MACATGPDDARPALAPRVDSLADRCFAVRLEINPELATTYGLADATHQRHVPEYWIADLDARLIEQWIGDDDRPALVTDSLQWHPGGAATPLVLDVPELFRSVLDT